MSELYDRRQAAGNWPADDPCCDPDANLAWYRDLVAELAGSLTRWRDPERGGGFPASCDPRKPAAQSPRGGRHVRE